MKVVNESALNLVSVELNPYNDTITVRVADVTFWVTSSNKVRSGAPTKSIGETYESRYIIGDDFFRVYVTEEREVHIYDHQRW